MNPIVSGIINYLTSIWTTLRIAFGVFDTDTMINLAQILTVVFVIGVIDNLPNFFGRAKERIIKKRKPKDDDEEYEWVQIRKRKS